MPGVLIKRRKRKMQVGQKWELYCPRPRDVNIHEELGGRERRGERGKFFF